MKKQWIVACLPGLRCFKEARVEELNISISVVNGRPSHRIILAKIVRLIWLTTTRILVSMLPCKREERGKLDPPTADFLFLIRIILRSGEEATCVRPDHWYAKHVHVHDTGDRVAHVCPGTMVITKPVLRVSTRASERATTEQEGAFAAETRNCSTVEQLFGHHRLHMTVK